MLGKVPSRQKTAIVWARFFPQKGCVYQWGSSSLQLKWLGLRRFLSRINLPWRLETGGLWLNSTHLTNTGCLLCGQRPWPWGFRESKTMFLFHVATTHGEDTKLIKFRKCFCCQGNKAKPHKGKSGWRRGLLGRIKSLSQVMKSGPLFQNNYCILCL